MEIIIKIQKSKMAMRVTSAIRRNIQWFKQRLDWVYHKVYGLSGERQGMQEGYGGCKRVHRTI